MTKKVQKKLKKRGILRARRPPKRSRTPENPKGAGRPPLLSDKAVRRNVSLEPDHIQKLEAYSRRYQLQGMGAAIRSLINKFA